MIHSPGQTVTASVFKCSTRHLPRILRQTFFSGENCTFSSVISYSPASSTCKNVILPRIVPSRGRETPGIGSLSAQASAYKKIPAIKNMANIKQRTMILLPDTKKQPGLFCHIRTHNPVSKKSRAAVTAPLKPDDMAAASPSTSPVTHGNKGLFIYFSRFSLPLMALSTSE